jgi:hypothetical protein
MPSTSVTGLVFVFAAALSLPAAAQWPSYPIPGVPRSADGKPILDAPTPRTADGKPDLSGVWDSRGAGGGGGAAAGRGAAAGARGGAPGAAPAGATGAAPAGPGAAAAGGGRGGRGAAGVSLDEIPNATFFNTGAGFTGGLPYQPWAAALHDERTASNAKDNPDAHCLPMGFMQLHLHPQPRKIVQTPGVTVIMYEGNYGLRQIFTDGRKLPANDPQPWWYGYSVGRWEGDTLVVESSGFRDGGWLDVNGSPFTDQLKLTERFRRLNYGTMQIDVTVDDPKAYTRPFTVRVNHRILPDEDLIEFVCAENEQSSKHYQN